MQPKNILFESGAPKVLAPALDGLGAPILPIDQWTQVLDLRNDPDNTVVRRLHLWVHWNYVPENPDPQEFADAFVSVIDDTITDTSLAVLHSIGNGLVPLASRLPVKIVDDYPIRGPVRVVAGSGPIDVDVATANNMVIFGYYTVEGAEGTRATLDRRPFQIGNVVPVNGASPVVLPAAPAEEDVHETSATAVDELSISYLSEPDLVLYFGTQDPLDPRYILAPEAGITVPLLSGTPMRNVGVITGQKTGLGTAFVVGSFTRY